MAIFGIPKAGVAAVVGGTSLSAQLLSGQLFGLPNPPSTSDVVAPPAQQLVVSSDIENRQPPGVSDRWVAQATVSSRGGVTPAGLNPAVSPAMQRATFERIFTHGRQLVSEGKVPVVVIDHRLTALDDRPIIRAGLETLVRRNNITELSNLDAAMDSGVLKFLPGYTEQASDHWRQSHPALVAKYPRAFGAPGERIPIDFMSAPLSQARATEGISAFVARWKAETQGRGEVVFAGAGSGRIEDLQALYTKPVAQGGAGLTQADVRFGNRPVSRAADARAIELARQFNASQPGSPPVVLDNDSRSKAGWVETIEQSSANRVVAAFIDDRAHNRLAVKAAAKDQRIVVVTAVAPGLSFSQVDRANGNQISTFNPSPR